jgi:SAM-dependent methyltransferase
MLKSRIKTRPYTNEFYSVQEPGSRRSAEVIVPLLVNMTGARSVVDVGCGTGGWLSVFLENHVEDILGIDGEWAGVRELLIPQDRFLPHDLTAPLRLSRQFDIATCLEVAEHLDTNHSESLVQMLVNLAPVVVFSAAIPFQGGTHHVNEQWPEFWATLFQVHHYDPVDCVREHIWNDERVCWWYAQNIIVYAKRDYLRSNVAMTVARDRTRASQLSIVHPRRYLLEVNALRGVPYGPGVGVPYNLGLTTVLRALPAMAMRCIIHYAKRWLPRKDG